VVNGAVLIDIKVSLLVNIQLLYQVSGKWQAKS
jgi:hypothetical protein